MHPNNLNGQTVPRRETTQKKYPQISHKKNEKKNGRKIQKSPKKFRQNRI